MANENHQLHNSNGAGWYGTLYPCGPLKELLARYLTKSSIADEEAEAGNGSVTNKGAGRGH